jgi:hypothetical protein
VFAPRSPTIGRNALRRFTALLALLLATLPLAPTTVRAVVRPSPLILIFHDAVNGGCAFFLTPVGGSFGSSFTVSNRTKNSHTVVERVLRVRGRGNADASWTYDVQYRAGDGAWTDWLVQTSDRSATFAGVAATTYRFRARTTTPTNGTNRWSPPRVAAT